MCANFAQLSEQFNRQTAPHSLRAESIKIASPEEGKSLETAINAALIGKKIVSQGRYALDVLCFWFIF